MQRQLLPAADTRRLSFWAARGHFRTHAPQQTAPWFGPYPFLAISNRMFKPPGREAREARLKYRMHSVGGASSRSREAKEAESMGSPVNT